MVDNRMVNNMDFWILVEIEKYRMLGFRVKKVVECVFCYIYSLLYLICFYIKLYDLIN